jgi:hypothetical protein
MTRRKCGAGSNTTAPLLDVCAANGADTPVLLLPSLGCQVLSSYLYDAQKARSRAAGRSWA